MCSLFDVVGLLWLYVHIFWCRKCSYPFYISFSTGYVHGDMLFVYTEMYLAFEFSIIARLGGL